MVNDTADFMNNKMEFLNIYKTKMLKKITIQKVPFIEHNLADDRSIQLFNKMQSYLDFFCFKRAPQVVIESKKPLHFPNELLQITWLFQF